MALLGRVLDAESGIAELDQADADGLADSCHLRDSLHPVQGTEETMWYRLLLILELPLLLIDCLGSLLVGESFQNTLSAKAWDARSQVHFYWTHSFIDAIFWPSHCEEQWVREQKYGSVWAAWLAQFKGS